MNVRPGRNLAFVFLLVMCVGSGITGLFAPPRSTDIAQALPRWGTLVWFGGLILFGVVGIAGILWHNLAGLQAERGAMLGLTGLCLGYATSASILCLVQDGLSAYTVTLTAAFGALCLSRVWQIRHEIARTIDELTRLGDALEQRPEVTP